MFSKKLDILMELLDVPNSELAKALFIDPSYISKLRNGKRKQPKNKEFVYEMAAFFVEKARERGDFKSLISITGEVEDKKKDIETQVYHWLVKENNINAIIDKLMGEISDYKSEGGDRKEWTHNNTENKVVITQYYDDNTLVEEMESILEKLLENKSNHDFFWFVDPLDFYLWQLKSVKYDYEAVIKKIIQNGNKIHIFFSGKDYQLKLIVMLYAFLPLFLSQQIRPYLVKESKNKTKPILYIKDGLSFIKLPALNSDDSGLFLLSNDAKMMEYTNKLFHMKKENSRSLLNVEKYKSPSQYKKMYENIYNDRGNFIYMEANLPFYSLPEDMAIKVDKKYPELNFYENYKYAYEQFINILSQKNLSEIIACNFKKKKGIVFAGHFIEYSQEDFKKHLLEIIHRLKKYKNYQIFLSDKLEKNTSLIANDRGGLVIEKYSEPKCLIQITDQELYGEFISNLHSHRKEAPIREKKEVIEYLNKIANKA